VELANKMEINLEFNKNVCIWKGSSHWVNFLLIHINTNISYYLKTAVFPVANLKVSISSVPVEENQYFDHEV
jgi:hypothetical protein